VLCHCAAMLRRHSRMVRKDQTRNLEIPGSMLAHRPGMTWAKKRRGPGHAITLSRRDAPEALRRCPPRGRGECRVPDAPAAPCAEKKHRSRSRRFTGITRHSRTRMAFTAYGALSPATNSSCHRHRRIEGCAEPGRARQTSADLTPATGARTTRFCRPHQHRSSARRLIAHEAIRPALRPHRAPDAAASTASHPNVRDDRDTPLVEG
jgi:hypothetical protein